MKIYVIKSITYYRLKKVIKFSTLQENKGEFTMKLINPQTYPQ